MGGPDLTYDHAMCIAILESAGQGKNPCNAIVKVLSWQAPSLPLVEVVHGMGHAQQPELQHCLAHQLYPLRQCLVLLSVPWA